MLITKKAYLAAALTSASLAALAMPTSAWAQAVANTTADCTEAVEETGNNPAATQFDPVTGDPILDPVTGDPVLVAAGDTIPFSTQCGVKSQASGSGSGAKANTANSTAIGTGAETTRDNQIVLGRKTVTANGVTTAGTSVTIADVAASTAAQVGPTDVMTVDASGTIGRDPSIRASIASLNTLTAKHTAEIANLFDLNEENRRQIGKGLSLLGRGGSTGCCEAGVLNTGLRLHHFAVRESALQFWK